MLQDFEQGGYVQRSNIVNFQIPFTTSHYEIMAHTRNDITGIYHGWTEIQSKTSTKANIGMHYESGYAWGGGQFAFDWIAKGY